MMYTIIAAVFITGLIFYYSRTRGSTTMGDSQQNDQQDQANPYEGLRNMALNTTPVELHLTLPVEETKVFAVVMDWDLSSGIATLTSLSTGDASMYYSTGGGILGGGAHKNVADAAKAFVETAQTYLDKTIETETTPLPEKNSVRFYLLTNKGRFTAREDLDNFDNRSSTWLPLFEEANKVISELRSVSEKK